ncbi:MAG: phosphoribosylformylglycinamidine synthase subunit PurS [Bacteroidetes bacterium]|nr:phosphoribosylformylglycinamidine synthase subunit PurS [Bacteroidota bacterium]MCH8246766.1 phosphoribosylformylglycinamidine synthase subunit PurS [Bacteroidota bacterium]
MYKARINVTLRQSILDPQGKAAHHALSQLGFDHVDEVRIGKHIELSIDAESEDSAAEVARQACEKLLANPVMEDYSVDIEPIEE